MATMVLTTLGGAVAGPVGAALGGLAGRAIDGAVFGTPARQGPRLNELQVQLSSYGAQIPKLFGTMRVAGTVIWATDLREAASTTGGKGTGRTTRYSYSASFAVALSGRPIRGIRRIWAEGKLLRGAAGDWKTRTGFRWYPGDEAQTADPLICSIVGAADAPAYRGVAYAVFEDLALADFGNRIPSLTFEVEADAAPVAAGAIVAALGNGAIVAEAGGPLLGGYAASGARCRDAIEALVEPLGGWYAVDGDHVTLRSGSGPARRLSDAVLPGDAPDWQRPPATPADFALAYHDVARDYQAGVQQVLRGSATRRMLRIELPAAMTAGVAAGIAGDIAARAALAGEVRTVALDWRAIDVAPGDRVTLSDGEGLWRVRRTRIEAMRITLELVRIAAATLAAPPAIGVPQLAADVATGATRLMLVELPSDTVEGAPWIGAIAAGTAPGWRRATLLVGSDAGGWTEIGETAAAGVIGRVTLPPAPASAMIEDRAGTIEVELLHDAMTLETIDDAALDRGGNAALVGGEILQFGTAQRIGPARWRLSRLWRGRRGSEAAIAGHRMGEGFALLDPATVRRIELPGAVGLELAVMAAGIVEGDTPTATLRPGGRALVPPAPVHLSVGREGDRPVLRWVRRTRLVAPWRDAIDTPLGEEREAYRLTLTDATGAVRTIEVAEPTWTIDPVAPLTVELRQIGTQGASPPALFHYRPETTR
ncbi:phage tail protein [Sphingomonas sp. 2R-10]|uniref:GTA baseplate fiber-binding domain-containing protein n=1 Tax=Sphingomonas sp. 2R-10 TaxID=3045148 RepID=UPI000F7934FE|nr:phage tail protein [Sphingomonas sp. 2R-10]MDJ0276410.1 phage tail protein [Sphingomonas sp. 2R-10]